MPFVRLVCWDETVKERARLLKSSGLTVDAAPFQPSGMIGQLRDNPPAAVVIDLDRRPSHGHAVALAMRTSKSVRHIPIVFAGGVPDKIERIRKELPDAVFADWKRIAPALKKALKNVPANPIQPTPYMHRYLGSSLAKKLGLKPKIKIALLAAPDGFEDTLGELPEGATVENRLTPDANLVIWFVRARLELERETDFLAARLPVGASLWIVHPKQSGRYKVDFNQIDVRATALACGLVDYKVCAVDDDWSGLKFTRKKNRSRSR